MDFLYDYPNLLVGFVIVLFTILVAVSGYLVFRRVAKLRGPMSVFGYDYFDDHAKKAGLPRPKLLDFEGMRGDGAYYAYEARNFADGRRTAQQITNELSAEFGAVPVALVVEYLKALETIGVMERVR